jgi:hypothetical protein
MISFSENISLDSVVANGCYQLVKICAARTLWSEQLRIQIRSEGKRRAFIRRLCRVNWEHEGDQLPSVSDLASPCLSPPLPH